MPPVNKKSTKSGSQNGESSQSSPNVQLPVSTTKSGLISIAIHAKPSAKESAVAGVSDTAVEVQISAPPKDGEANTELVRFMAETLGLKRSQIALDKGSKSREKTLLLDADCGLTVDGVMDRLKSVSEKNWNGLSAL